MATYEYNDSLVFIVMDVTDNVATSLRRVSKGEKVVVQRGTETLELIVQMDIPSGHKIALQPIAQGANVLKYGEAIGAATTSIALGEHVHVHNIEGIRGRGDKSKEEEVSQ
ncbi:UxaA family hydrolase [Aureibacillus halotolerans]|uniref:Altronate dehydratase small subunit n=1 Tax=Aureibacillus halotolerans TaxID=1508390 RepID=A0A4R6TTK5_9BACI|nr:UxaA family hydrolase [Aureibacillus halotolerans]TDQ36436.1 altronate dehydratase small subunit [Aureibacillus halotolerans]